MDTHGLTPIQWAVIRALSAHGPLSYQGLAKIFGRAPTNTCKALLWKGYIKWDRTTASYSLKAS